MQIEQLQIEQLKIEQLKIEQLKIEQRIAPTTETRNVAYDLDYVREVDERKNGLQVINDLPPTLYQDLLLQFGNFETKITKRTVQTNSAH